MRTVFPLMFLLLLSGSMAAASVQLIGLKGGIAKEEPSEVSITVSDPDFDIHIKQLTITFPSEISIANTSDSNGTISSNVFELANFDIEKGKTKTINVMLNSHEAGTKVITSYLFYIPYTLNANGVRTYYRLNMQAIAEPELTDDDYWQLGPYHQNVNFLEQECTKNEDCNPLKCVAGNITCVEGHCKYENCETVQSVLGRVNWESKTTAIIIISIAAILGIVIIARKK